MISQGTKSTEFFQLKVKIYVIKLEYCIVQYKPYTIHSIVSISSVFAVMTDKTASQFTNRGYLMSRMKDKHHRRKIISFSLDRRRTQCFRLEFAHVYDFHSNLNTLPFRHYYLISIRSILRNPRHNQIPDSIPQIPVVLSLIPDTHIWIPDSDTQIPGSDTRIPENKIDGFENKMIKKPIGCLPLLTKS